MPLYDFKCKDCETVIEEFRAYEHRDIPIDCPLCQGDMYRAFLKMPGVTRASFIDSKKTARAAEANQLARASRLEEQSENYRVGSEERNNLKAEARKLREIKK